MKRFLYYCPKCKKVTLMLRVKEDKNTETTFLKCVVCSASESKKSSKESSEALEAKNRVREYNPKETYKVGDTIFHKTFDEIGEVIKITKRYNGQIINTVLFSKAGIKKLISIPEKKVQSM
ncbi:hypothetical protein ACFL2A_05100 [Thermodesulfobacteriota bacterium]